MALTTTAKRRLTLLLGLIVVVSGGLALLHQYQQGRRAERAERYRDEGLAAFERQEHRTALEHLGRYHTEVGGDGQTLYAYAQSRLAIPTEDSRYLVEGMYALQRAIAHPDAPDRAAHELLELYTDLGNNNNALDLAESLLRDDPDDVEAWRAKAIALTRLTEHERGLDAAERALELEAGHWQTLLLTFQLKSALGESTDALIDHAEQLVEQHPDDPRYEMLLGYAHSLQRDREPTVRWLIAAAGREPPDEQFVETLLRFLDSADLYDEARRYLAARVDRDSSPQLYQEMIQRLIEGGHFREAADRLAHVDPAAEGLSNRHARLAGLRAMALYRLGEREQARTVTDALARQTNRPLAVSWANVLEAVYGDDASTGRALQAADQALTTFPENASFRAMRAAAYEDVGEIELALADWRRAAERRPSWSMPHIRRARLLVQRGEPGDAIRHAEAGLVRQPHSVQAALVLAQARAAALDPNDPAQVEILLTLLERIGDHELGNAALPLHVEVLARAERGDDAAALVRHALARESEQDRPLTRAMLRSLTQIAERYGLDVGDALRDRIEQAQDLAGPEAVVERALARAREGDPEAGLALIERELEDSDDADTRAWHTARAEYLSQVGDPRAAEAWIELARAHADDPGLQQRALRAGAAEHDPDFARQAIDRLRELLGSESLIWRIERARWLLEGPEQHRDPIEAARLLEPAVSRAPDQIEPRLLLAQAHEQRGLRPLAIRELRAAADRRPQSNALALELARLYQSMRQFRSAREQLNRVVDSARAGRATPAHLRRAATMLAEQGQDAAALRVLQDLHQRSAEFETPLLGTSDRLLLAELLHRTGQREAAAAVIDGLLDAPSPPPAVLGFAANFHAGTGDTDRADEALARLEDESGEADDRVQRLLLAADHLARRGDLSAARDRYRRAADADPQRATLWQQLVAFDLLRGEPATAMETARQARRQLSEPDRVLGALLEARELIESLDGNDPLVGRLGTLVRAAADAPEAIADAVRMLGESERAGMSPAALASRAESLADQHPHVQAVQELAARLHLAADRPESAAQIATRAMNSFPRAAEPAWLASRALSQAGQWREARRAAEQWRQRSGGVNLSADLMIAEADLALGQASTALSVLEPHLEHARANPDTHAPVLVRYARALIAAGRDRDAEALLAPMLERSAAWRNQFISLAVLALRSESTARRWLDRAAEHIDDDAINERAALAGAWSQLADRIDDPTLRDRARRILDDLVERAPDDGRVWMRHGIVADQQDDPETATASYRRALELDEELHVARNNLAMLLVTHEPTDPDAALEHARRVAGAVPDNPHFLDTLAHAHAAVGDCEAAIETMQEVIRLRPGESVWRDHLVEILAGCGQEQRAPEILEGIDG